MRQKKIGIKSSEFVDRVELAEEELTLEGESDVCTENRRRVLAGRNPTNSAVHWRHTSVGFIIGTIACAVSVAVSSAVRQCSLSNSCQLSAAAG
ncbi:unnamed protein product [Euphydryas editha]|uniref:Uncharacterized protein n=1 Tax=Euphydryas editha TaxID=104508 RepID=A0AAU9U8G7_EUPED|nr:unnamed protein product [Euphydryas editha]